MSEAEVPSTETETSFHAAVGQCITTYVGLSWRELAKQVDTNDSTIRGWLKSTNPIPAENLEKLLRVSAQTSRGPDLAETPRAHRRGLDCACGEHGVAGWRCWLRRPPRASASAWPTVGSVRELSSACARSKSTAANAAH